MDWFLYDIGLRHERVKCLNCAQILNYQNVFVSIGKISLQLTINAA